MTHTLAQKGRARDAQTNAKSHGERDASTTITTGDGDWGFRQPRKDFSTRTKNDASGRHVVFAYFGRYFECDMKWCGELSAMCE